LTNPSEAKSGFWTNGRGARFFAWVDSWARWLDVVGIALWVFLTWFFVDFSLNSYREYEPTAGLYTAVIAVIIFFAGLGIRFTIYRFVQRRHK
jgi:hypothetical protein